MNTHAGGAADRGNHHRTRRATGAVKQAGKIFPFAHNKNISSAVNIDKTNTVKTQPLAIAFPVNNKETVALKSCSEIQPFNNAVTIKKRVTKKQVIKDDNDYTIALINKDLIKENRHADVIATNENEMPDTSYYVKIEEEQSGKTKMNVYYFWLNKDKGNTNIKPLIFLNKPIRIQTKNKAD